MKNILCSRLCSWFAGLALFFVSATAWSWGLTGHRAVGEIAEKNLNAKAKKEVRKLLGGEPMSTASTWADEIRSNPAYRSYAYWHYVSVDDGKTYQESEKNEKGDVIAAINKAVETLKNAKTKPEEKTEALKLLIHFIGDMHQPLHVGRREDKGGNDIKVIFFGEESNLHEVWDEKIIDHKRFGYTEMAKLLGEREWKDKKDWLKNGVEDWASESVKYRAQVYEFTDDYIPEDGLKALFAAPVKNPPKDKPKLSYQYAHRNWPLIEQRIYQAGIRLAKTLNEIFK